MNGNSTRYHAEIKVQLEGREARINVFADTLAEVFNDIGTICSQFPPDWLNPAKREIINAERKAAQLREKGLLPKRQPAQPGETGEVPVCPNCGTDEGMDLIRFTDKKTGQPRQEWKCQTCGQWYFPNGKKK